MFVGTRKTAHQDTSNLPTYSHSAVALATTSITSKRSISKTVSKQDDIEVSSG